MPAFLALIADEAPRGFMEELYFTYRSAMYEAAYAVMRHHQDTEDIIQDTILKLIEKFELLQRFECFTLRSYVVISVRRTAIDLLRRRGRRSELLFDDEIFLDHMGGEGETPEDCLLRETETQHLHAALERLAQRQRDLLNMKYFLELSDAEIAETYGIAKGSVRSLLSRARKALAEKMKEFDDA